MTWESVNSGVVSVGRAQGLAVRVGNPGQGDLDQHLLSVLDGPENSKLTSAVFFADRASVDLLPLVARCGVNCAFVFRRASLLAHLCVVLREKGIPALVLEEDENWDALNEGRPVMLDAITEGMIAGSRIRWGE